MTTLREAAQQALEALEAIDEDPYATHSFPALSNDAITALRAALAQEERCRYPDCKCPTENPCLKGLAQEEQEPPRREWQGLTYQEIDDLQSGMQVTFKDICAIEAALKEKNT